MQCHGHTFCYGSQLCVSYKMSLLLLLLLLLLSAIMFILEIFIYMTENCCVSVKFINHNLKISLRRNNWTDNKVRELIALKVLHTSLLNTTMVAFKVLPLRSYVPMSASSPPFKTILELVLWNGPQSCCSITPDVTNVIKMPSFQYFLYLLEQKKSLGTRSGE